MSQTFGGLGTARRRKQAGWDAEVVGENMVVVFFNTLVNIALGGEGSQYPKPLQVGQLHAYRITFERKERKSEESLGPRQNTFDLEIYRLSLDIWDIAGWQIQLTARFGKIRVSKFVVLESIVDSSLSSVSSTKTKLY